MRFSSSKEILKAKEGVYNQNKAEVSFENNKNPKKYTYYEMFRAKMLTRLLTNSIRVGVVDRNGEY